MFSLTLAIKHTTDEAGVEHINIDQTLSGGISGDSENRTLDWQERDEYDDIFGAVTGKSRRIPVEEITDEFLKKDWTQDTINDDIVLTDSWSTPGKNSYTWRAVQVIASFLLFNLFLPAQPNNQTWGFAMVNEERRYVRHTTFTSSQKQDGPIHTRFVYDYRKYSIPLAFGAF